MNEWEKVREDTRQEGTRDNPEQYPTDKESQFDKFISQRNVDPLPMEDLTLEMEEEKRKTETKHQSSSANKYKPYDVEE
ncbi:hypothetical protein [Paenibacillus sp. 1P07SE]|uniref:hypothetical protein n=1 Tax=Paenibacillus sp. 1P07SE TaxID=3132209 RepID=UPI0039A5F967